MAQLRDTVVQGNLQVTDAISSDEVYIDERKVGNGRVFYGTCPTAAATTAKVVVCPSYDEVKEGDMLTVKFANTSTATASQTYFVIQDDATSPIHTLSTTALIKCQIAATVGNLPSGYLLANRPYSFVYDGVNWILLNINRDNDTNTIGQVTKYSQNVFKAASAIAKTGKLLLQGENNLMIPVSAKTATANETTPTITTASFLIFGDYIYYGTTAAANAVLGQANAYTRGGFDLRYSFNIGGTTTAQQDLYLVAIPDADGIHAKIANRTGTGIGASSPITNQLPNTEDNKIYIKLFSTYNTTGSVVLTENHPVYWFKNGKLRPYTAPYGTVSTVSGNTLSLVDIDSTQVATYVPSVTIPGSTPVLEWNTGVTLATVNNVDIKAALPSNPWKVYYSSATPTGTIAEGSLWLKPM